MLLLKLKSWMSFCRRTKNNCVEEPEKISVSIESPETKERAHVFNDEVMKRNERANTMRKESYDQHSHGFDDGEYQLDLDTTNETFTERCRSNGRKRVANRNDFTRVFVNV